MLRDELDELKRKFINELKQISDSEALEALRIKYMGKKGLVTLLLKGMGDLPPEERPAAGQAVNGLKEELAALLDNEERRIKAAERQRRLEAETIDVTMPGKRPVIGKRHPLSIVRRQIEDIFIGMGFEIADGPEVEYDYYNFEALNIPKDHPSRDLQDTFYITDNIVLRTQTSPVQIRVMESHKPPIRIIAPGRVYRSDEVDATHSPIFHQMEGLVVDHGITMGDLKGVLDVFAKALYGEDTRTKFRPHYFPFTEPSAEVDVTCAWCHGQGCRICGYSGWIEVLGAGMVHPNVLRTVGINPDEYSGFAFGLGLDRLTMLKYGIDDMRLLFENDYRFLKQF
ncbi:MAG: phenylalanyl-tRNA synthetase alpha chain [Clostridiales bacterium]|nr:phenylalanyl-tRNA synthetase alpha chain [Clostridiales bacterium]